MKRVAEDEQGKKSKVFTHADALKKKKHQVAARLTFSFPHRQKRATSAVHTLFHVSDLLHLKKLFVLLCTYVQASRSAVAFPLFHMQTVKARKKKKIVTIVLKHLGSFSLQLIQLPDNHHIFHHLEFRA